MPSYLDNKVRFFVRNQLFPRNFLKYPPIFPGVSCRSGYLSSRKTTYPVTNSPQKITESRICLFSKQILLSFVIKIASRLREISQSLSKNLTLSSKSLAYTPFPYADRLRNSKPIYATSCPVSSNALQRLNRSAVKMTPPAAAA